MDMYERLERILAGEPDPVKRPPRKKIVWNAIRCNNCGDVIESTYRHEFVTCSCGKVSGDGGHDYLRRCSETPDGYTELSEWTKPDDAQSGQ